MTCEVLQAYLDCIDEFCEETKFLRDDSCLREEFKRLAVPYCEELEKHNRSLCHCCAYNEFDESRDNLNDFIPLTKGFIRFEYMCYKNSKEKVCVCPKRKCVCPKDCCKCKCNHPVKDIVEDKGEDICVDDDDDNCSLYGYEITRMFKC